MHDPEMRHGRKSSSNRFNGHKAALVVDTDSQLVTAVNILPGNASDNTGVLELVSQSEENTGSEVEETIGDVAYGDGGTRQAFADAGLLSFRELVDALGPTRIAGDYLQESRTGRNIRHHLVQLRRQSIYSRLAGYDDTNPSLEGPNVFPTARP